jgi:hypothetical protein
MEGVEKERRAVAALATSVALPALDTESAARFAETEGLATHLTSLVLVDEDGAVQESIPATRKVALPSPRLMELDFEAEACPRRFGAKEEAEADEFLPLIAPKRSRGDLRIFANKIDWDAAPQRLQAGDISALDREVARAIRSAAATTEVVALARRLGLDPVVLVVGLVARSECLISRSAARLSKAILGDIAREELDHITQVLGLKGGSDAISGN